MVVMKNVQTLKNYIGGQWIESTSKQVEDVPNPATGELLATVPVSTKEDVEQAVQAVAKSAFMTWRKVPVPKRARILFKYQQLLNENREEFAKLVISKMGKAIRKHRGKYYRGIECVEFASGAPTLMMGERLPDIATDVDSGMYRYPFGVIGWDHSI